MATASKSSHKKTALLDKPMDKITIEKLSLKKNAPPKESNIEVIKKSVVKVGSLKKSVNTLVKKSTKEIVLKKSTPVKAVAEKYTAKAKAINAIANPNKPVSNNSGQIKKDLGALPNTIPETKQVIAILIDPRTVTEVTPDTNTSTASTEIYTSPIAHPDFRSSKSDGCQNKIQVGNKSKSGRKASGKKPLW